MAAFNNGDFGMGKPYKFSKDLVIKAIKDSGAIISTIAKRLNCNWQTAKNYVEKWADTQQAFKDEEETILDICETTLLKNIKKGNSQDAKWMLATKGKKRGFIEGKDINLGGQKDNPLNIVIKDVNEYEDD